jgi:hypothetical protein
MKQVHKTIRAFVCAGLAVLGAQQVLALTATSSFDVTVNLYPKCEFTTAPSALALNYVSFQTTPSTNTMTYGVRCTNTLPYTLSFTGTAGDSGTLVGLNYTLATTSGSQTGTGSAQTHTVTGTIAANQSGTCAQDNTATTGAQVASVTGATAGNGTACVGTSAANAHILTVTY